MDIGYLMIILCFVPLIMENKNDNIGALIHLKKKGDRVFMEKLLQELVGKHCIVTTLKGDYIGELVEVNTKSLLLKKNEIPQIINLEYVISARLFPLNKKGKKKILYM